MNIVLKTAGALGALALGYSIPHPARAAGENPMSVDAPSQGVLEWRGLMKLNPPPDKGCFHGTYPNAWEKVDCTSAQPRVHPTHGATSASEADDAGNTDDYAARAKGMITSAEGGLEIKGVTSEHGAGVAEYHYDGVLGPNEYSIQMNTNDKATSSAWGCSSKPHCKVWQQFVYSTDYIAPGIAEVYMQYWLLDYGACPAGWNHESKTSNCWVNSP